ncbi:MAG: tetratricopeptide repeat protein [Candidatus Aenigmarchaeota archaeon]|nr:tetratricopeptide repeat protein [Candidatus Aenigmarchaeota archaeon]
MAAFNEAYCNRGIAHRRMGNFGLAVADFQCAAQILNPTP